MRLFLLSVSAGVLLTRFRLSESNSEIGRREIGACRVYADCSHGIGVVECVQGYCLCPQPFYGSRCAERFGDEVAATTGGAFDSEYSYLVSAPFQAKQRLAASFVAGADFVLEIAGGRANIGTYLMGGASIYHNVDPAAEGHHALVGGRELLSLPMLLEEYDYPMLKVNATRALVVLGATPPTRSYCQSILTKFTHQFETIVIEAPVIGDVMAIDFIASALTRLLALGYVLEQIVHLNPCSTYLSLPAVLMPGEGGDRLPEGIYPQDCLRFLFVFQLSSNSDATQGSVGRVSHFLKSLPLAQEDNMESMCAPSPGMSRFQHLQLAIQEATLPSGQEL